MSASGQNLTSREGAEFLMRLGDRNCRHLYAQCDRCRRRVPLDLRRFRPDLDHVEVGKRLKCSQCGNVEVLAIPQTMRQMRQGRER
jgi:hypothetical protein